MLPQAAAHLDSLTTNIENYLNTQAASAVSESEGATSSVSRGGETVPLEGPTIYELNLAVATIPAHNREVLLRVDGYGSEPPGESAVWIAQASATAESLRIFRTHSDGSKAGEWRIVPDDGSNPAEWNSMAADILLTIRPDFAELLSLPSGFSVSIDSNGVALIRDAKERPVWQRGAD
jgi:hypothetical protein